ncbi:coiled-coil domain-containing protein 148-like [Penaeus chinensis]|uniref:coiled-coil domain-containing protein 148-like n=1 Tax=Penaeus chinensis TaxID=139456 RepID=UPI001FB81E6F|nr:coiled-coil domain-containing protein 148-like [Penaeus chinensis]
MRMLRRMLGISLKEQRTNEEVLTEAGVTSISSKIEEARLTWFGLVKRRHEEEGIRKAMDLPIPGKRSRGRQRKRWLDCVMAEMKKRNIKKQWAQDRKKWRKTEVRQTDPKTDMRKLIQSEYWIMNISDGNMSVTQ